MTQRYRRRAVEVEAERVTMVDGHQTWLVSGPRGRTFVDPLEFEREYEPVPSEGDVSRACMICEQTAKSLQLADKLAEAVKRMSTRTVGGVLIPMTSDVAAALSEYLESRGKGKGE